jgi:hypothetical protein
MENLTYEDLTPEEDRRGSQIPLSSNPNNALNEAYILRDTFNLKIPHFKEFEADLKEDIKQSVNNKYYLFAVLPIDWYVTEEVEQGMLTHGNAYVFRTRYYNANNEVVFTYDTKTESLIFTNI